MDGFINVMPEAGAKKVALLENEVNVIDVGHYVATFRAKNRPFQF